MHTHLSELALERVPAQSKQPLRAWDAADELVLAHLDEVPPADGTRVLLVNDSFGALACGVRGLDPIVINESDAGREAIAKNLAANELPPVVVHSMLELGTTPELAEPFDVVIIKIPKALAHLADLLHRLRPLLHGDTRVVGAAMVKHLQRSAIDTFAELVGPPTTSLAQKKARLVHVEVDPGLVIGTNPWPVEWSAFGSRLVNHGGGFSPSSLDIGTAMLLDSVADFAELLGEATGDEVRAVDLGCGNGIIGLRLARDLAADCRTVAVDAIDDSALAIDATRRSWDAWDRTSLERSPQLSLHHHHRMIEALDPKSVDLVVVNPPFHDDRVVGDHIAWSMFTDAHRVLRTGGSLVVVGNRHLGYHAKLAKIFGAVEPLGANKRFVVLRARR